MPELPEVEVTRLGILPHLNQRTLTRVVVRQPKLRWPIPSNLSQLQQQVLQTIERRGKCLIFTFPEHACVVHLGMSGHLRITTTDEAWQKHDHWQWAFEGIALRYQDPRRFGSLVWLDALQTQRLARLGPEPLSDDFHADYLYEAARNKTQTVKAFLMRQDVVVGVGNIYANEALFGSSVHPMRAAHSLTIAECASLVEGIKAILAQAITVGGTTLKDFANADGKPGYFSQQLNVYGLAGKPCPVCHHAIEKCVIAQRSTFYCSRCQPPH